MSPESDKKSLFFVPSFSCLSKIPDDELHSELETLYSILNCRLSIKSILSKMIFTDEEFKCLSLRGLLFCQTPWTLNTTQILDDLERYNRRLRLDEFFVIDTANDQGQS